MIRPLSDNVVIRRFEAEENTKGGIILTSANKEVPQTAEVLAVGPGTEESPMQVAPGDKVIFKKYGGTEIDVDGEEVIIVPQDCILAVIE